MPRTYEIEAEEEEHEPGHGQEAIDAPQRRRPIVNTSRYADDVEGDDEEEEEEDDDDDEDDADDDDWDDE